MHKVIKKFNKDGYIYQLGYNLKYNKLYPRIEAYRNKKLLYGNYFGDGTGTSLFYFDADYYSSNGNIGTIKEMFTWLRKYSDVPEEVEREFESLFILYKINNFKEL